LDDAEAANVTPGGGWVLGIGVLKVTLDEAGVFVRWVCFGKI